MWRDDNDNFTPTLGLPANLPVKEFWKIDQQFINFEKIKELEMRGKA